MKSTLSLIIFTYLIVWGFLGATALSCDSCGSECASACGTRHFRTCCFNYVRKRSDSKQNHPYPLNSVNYEILYGKVPDYDVMKRGMDRPQKALDHSKTLDIGETKYLLNFYKPWKEANYLNALDNVQLLNEYEQQQNNYVQGQKQQPSYDA